MFVNNFFVKDKNLGLSEDENTLYFFENTSG